MDLLKLDSNNQPTVLVENYDSLIWTERFNTLGDFQLIVGKDIGSYFTMLPEGTNLTLRESNVVMRVENHKMERKKNSPEKMIITGRTFDSVLDRRVSIKSLTDTTEWTVNTKTPSDLAYYVINQICVTGLLDSADIFPSAQVLFPTPSDYLASSGPTKAFVVQRGNLLSTVLGLLQTEAAADATTSPATPAVVPHGIRAVRPSATGTAVNIEIYTGTDRTATVYFDATRDLLDDGNYLFSKVGSANVAYIVGQTTSAKMNKSASTPTGLDRRVILVDATTSGVDDITILKTEGSKSLTEARETALFDGSINQDLSPYVYGVDYGLGDLVKLVGDYGLAQTARVTEYIRSEDNTGFKSYPTLTTI